MEANKSGKGYTDEQWEALLNQTFFDSTPAPKATEAPKPVTQVPTPPPAPKPEPPQKAEATPTTPAAKKKRKIRTLVWILLALSLVFAIVAVHVFPLEDDTDAITKEQRQCMKALRQWQNAQYYQLSTTTNTITPSSYNTNSESVYWHGDNCELSWTYTRDDRILSSSMANYYIGQAKIDEKQYTYNSTRLSASHWNTTTGELEFTLPWIMTFSFNDVQVLDQHSYEKDGGIHVISFTVMDTDRNAAYYDQGPYRVDFLFNKKGELYSVMHYHTPYSSNHLTITTYNHTETTAGYIEKRIRSQIGSPYDYPHLIFNSSIVKPETPVDD